MKGTEHFKQVIKSYLDKRAESDELFRAKYETTTRTIEDIATYILNEVKASGCCGFTDDEIYSMAVHVIDEPDIEIGKPITCGVVVNHHVELTEEEKNEQKAIALKRFQDEELRKLQTRNSKPKAVKPQENKQPELSLFGDDFLPMKARTQFEKQEAASNVRLTAVAPKVMEWGVKNLFRHPAFRVPSGLTTCGDCGHKFRHKGKGLFVVCPHCGHRLEIKDTLNRTHKESTYYAVLDTIDGLQVERLFLLSVEFKKGQPIKYYDVEVCRLWLNSKCQTALTSKARTIGYYRDCFNWGSEIELRNMSDVHHIIANTWHYPRYKAIPELRRNGMKGTLPDCHPFELMKALLTDTRIETLMKAGNLSAVKYFLNNKSMLDKCWNSHKIAMRNGYIIKDYGLWCDLITLLDKSGKDIRNAKYICPVNLNASHDLWLNKVSTKEEKRRKAEELAKAKKAEKKFYQTKSCYFGIVIKDKDIEVSVLDSIEAYQNEGEAMHHCVFKCSYYDREDSIILSAHDKDGNRIETIEFSLTENKVIQSRGVCNSNTELHDRIVNLVNANAHRFIKAKASA